MNETYPRVLWEGEYIANDGTQRTGRIVCVFPQRLNCGDFSRIQCEWQFIDSMGVMGWFAAGPADRDAMVRQAFLTSVGISGKGNWT